MIILAKFTLPVDLGLNDEEISFRFDEKSYILRVNQGHFIKSLHHAKEPINLKSLNTLSLEPRGSHKLLSYCTGPSDSDCLQGQNVYHLFPEDESSIFSIATNCTYTLIEVASDSPDYWVQLNLKDYESIRNGLEKAVSYYIDVLRISTSTNLVGHYSERLAYVPLLYASTDHPTAMLSDLHSVNLTLVETQLKPFDTKEFGHNAAIQNNEQLELLRENLKKGITLSVRDRLLLQAKEVAFLQGDNDLAIVLIQAAFEVGVQNMLMEACELYGIERLSRGNHKAPYDEAIAVGEVVNHLLKKYFRQICGKDALHGQLNEEWFEYCYTRRNDIVHRGILGATDVDAGKAFHTAHKYHDHLESILFSDETRLRYSQQPQHQ